VRYLPINALYQLTVLPGADFASAFNADGYLPICVGRVRICVIANGVHCELSWMSSCRPA
jgi:hypothetical protein